MRQSVRQTDRERENEKQEEETHKVTLNDCSSSIIYDFRRKNNETPDLWLRLKGFPEGSPN